jgi:hypothetical protein
MSQTVVNVNTPSKAYEVIIGGSLLSKAGELSSRVIKPARLSLSL